MSGAGSISRDEEIVLPIRHDTVTVLGSRWRANERTWAGLDFSRALVRTQSTLMMAICGDDAPLDLHLDVPFCHPNDQPEGWEDGMVYRVRPIPEAGTRWKRRMVDNVSIERDDARDPPWIIRVRFAPRQDEAGRP